MLENAGKWHITQAPSIAVQAHTKTKVGRPRGTDLCQHCDFSEAALVHV
jgi:hypothetical protein